MLDIIAGNHCMQPQGNLIIQTQENSEKNHFGPDLSPKSDLENSGFLSHEISWSAIIMYNIRIKVMIQS